MRADLTTAPRASAAGAQLRVERFDGTPAEWDAFVRRQPGWTHFHLHGWRDVIGGVLRHDCPYLVARDATTGALAGVLPLVLVRSVLFGRYLVSLPFVNYGGPLGSAEAVRALAAAAVARGEAAGVKLVELRSRGPQPLDLPVSHRKITVVLDLPTEGPEALMKRFPAKLRSQVRRPQKEGVTVRFGADQVAPFFAVFARHMRDLGTPTQPARLFEALMRTFPDDAWFGCAWLGDRPIACGAGFVWGDEFEMTWASALTEFNRIAPNMLLYWAFMERAMAAGLRRFNFGRCTPGGGTHRFKRQWGAEDEPLWWYQHAPGAPADADATAVHTPSPDDGAYAWGPRLWKRLPLPVATALGPRIVRCIP
ncbi:MAG TPA: FemAB family XrtA/PEP-CTERM system-associated protein [Gemmatimonadales bacterium]|nr:FemAB family XrtA/PEP-CTERM system-associated protein [Gemmatimonadales bacterium]